MTKAAEQSDESRALEAEQDKIFIEMPIPRTLAEIGFLQAEKDIKAGKARVLTFYTIFLFLPNFNPRIDGTGSTLYGIVTGLKSDMSGAAEKPQLLEAKVEDEEKVIEKQGKF